MDTNWVHADFEQHDDDTPDNEYSCVLEVNCQICGKKEQVIFHDPEAAEAFALDPVEYELYVCPRCEQLEENFIEHQYEQML